MNVNPTRQEVVDLYSECRRRGRIMIWDSSKLGCCDIAHPRVNARIRRQVDLWTATREGRARIDRICLEQAMLSDWEPTRWDQKAAFHNRQVSAEVAPVWKRLDPEIDITHVVYLVGWRNNIENGHKFEMSAPNDPTVLTVVGQRIRQGATWPPGYHGRWYTELQCICPIATASRIGAMAVIGDRHGA